MNAIGAIDRDRRSAQRGDDLDGRPHGLEREATACQDLLVALDVQIAEAGGELDLLPIDGDRPVAGLAGRHACREVVAVDRHEPADLRAPAHQETGGAPGLAQMRHVETFRPEHERQHVEEMHPDVGGDTSRLRFVALPRAVVPAPARGDVDQLDLEPACRGGLDLLLQRHHRGMQAQLLDRENPVSGGLLGLLQTVEAPRIEHQRLFTDGVRIRAQGEATMGIVQIIGEQIEI